MASAIGELSYNTFEDETLADLDRRLHPSRQAEPVPAENGLHGTSTFQVAGDVPARPVESEIQSISRAKKAIAACAGAFTTSILMTPFDVVKTRLQVQSHEPSPIPPPARQPPSRYSDIQTGSIRQNYLKARGGRGVFAAQAARTTAPLSQEHASPRTVPFSQAASWHLDRPDRLEPRMGQGRWSQALRVRTSLGLNQAQHQPSQFDGPPRLIGMIDGFVQVGRREGVRGLWRGLTPTILMTVPSQVTYMVCYDFFKESINKSSRSLSRAGGAGSGPGGSSSLAPSQLFTSLVAGASARSISATLVTPLELVRTRLQAVDGDSHGGVRANLRLLIEEAKAHPSSLWRGLGPTLYRDVPFSAIYFTAYESLKRSLTGGSGLGERRDGAHSHSSEFAVAFVSGASAGILAALLTHPFDLIKTRRQVLSNPQGETTTMQLLRAVYAREGVHGLLRGLSPRIAKVGPACGIMIGSFEVVGRLLDT